MEDIVNISNRVKWIKGILASSGAKGIVYGNSGGKDSALTGILCKMATDNVTGIIMPCESSINYGTDREHALLIAARYNINVIEADLTPVKREYRKLLEPLIGGNNSMAYNNINPRLRMITLYAYAQSMNYLVAGSGNLSEYTIGYFTKWGDGAYDFNPIGDLTVSGVYKMLVALDCPEEILTKAPSAGLYEGQTDENEMGISYKEIDEYILTGSGSKSDLILERINSTAHKRKAPPIYNYKP
jgi:NAD+ synthase